MYRMTMIFSLFVLAACAGSEGPAGLVGADGVDGVDGVDGAGGADGVDGADGSAFASGMLAPGEYLSLSHGLEGADKVYDAQFSWNGVVYDHADYPTLLPGHTDGTWALENESFTSYRGGVAGDLLASGDFVMFHSGVVGDIDLDDEPRIAGAIRDADGTVLTELPNYAMIEEDGLVVNFSKPAVAATADGGFALVMQRETAGADSDLLDAVVERFDASGHLLSSTPLDVPDVAIETLEIDAFAGGGFVVVASGEDSSEDTTGGQAVDVVFFDADGVGATIPRMQGIDAGYGRVTALPDGRAAVLVELLPEGEPEGIAVRILQSDGTIDSETMLHETYMTRDAAIVYGSQDTILVAAESGGPDMPFFAVLRTDGTILQEATGMSGWENNEIEAGAFADGDFLVLVTEDDSLAPMTWVVGAQGGLLRPMVIGDISVVPDYERGDFMATGEDHTLGRISVSYESEVPQRFSRYTKGLLQIRVESDAEVRIYNHTPRTLDVTLAAHSAN